MSKPTSTDIDIPIQDAEGDEKTPVSYTPTDLDWLPDTTGWQPNYLSLPAVWTWAYTRHLPLTRYIDEHPERDKGDPLSLPAMIASIYKLEIQKDERDVLPDILRLIEDEKLGAEGASQIHQLNSELIKHLPHDLIPSGGARRLIIDDRTLAPRYSLVANELYRLTGHGPQGRYWYDVRFKAEEVFREFPPLSMSPMPTDQVDDPQPRLASEDLKASSVETKMAWAIQKARFEGAKINLLTTAEVREVIRKQLEGAGLKEPSERSFGRYVDNVAPERICRKRRQ